MTCWLSCALLRVWAGADVEFVYSVDDGVVIADGFTVRQAELIGLLGEQGVKMSGGQ